MQYSVADVSAGLPLIRGGKLRPLAVTSLRRIKDLPDVPTMQESGNKGFEAYAWTAAFFPARRSIRPSSRACPTPSRRWCAARKARRSWSN